MSLTATEAHAPKHQTRIGLIACIAFAVGNMVGAGVFVLSGPAVRDAGPGAILSFGAAGLCVLLSALSFSIVASLAKEGESGYAYVSLALSPFWGFLTSWSFYLGGLISAAFILNSFGIYIHQFFLPTSSAVLYSIGAAVLLTLLNLGPASAIGKAETLLVGIKVLILALLIIFGLLHFSTSPLKPFAPHGWPTIFKQSGQLFIAFLGFGVVSSMAGDVKNASKTVPLAIMLSMLIVTIIYAGVVICLIMARLPDYNESSVGRAAATLIGPWGQTLVAVAALVSILSSANANILGPSETMVRLAATGMVPTVAGKMWNGHPVVSVLFGALVYITLMLTGQTDAIISMSNVTAIIMMILVNIAGFIALRQKLVYAKWYPYGLIIPVLGLATACIQLALIDWSDLLIGAGMIFAGGLLYSIRKRFFDPKDHREINHRLAHNDGPAGRALSDYGQKDVQGDGILESKEA
jgi:amino acid transporter